MTPINEGELIGGDRATEVTGGLGGTQATAVRKSGQHVPMAGIFDLGTEPGRESEVSVAISYSCPILQ